MLDDIDSDKQIASILDAGEDILEDLKQKLSTFCDERQRVYEESILDRIEDKMKTGFQQALESERLKHVPTNIGPTATTDTAGIDDDAHLKASRLSTDPPTTHAEDPPHRLPQRKRSKQKHPFDGNRYSCFMKNTGKGAIAWTELEFNRLNRNGFHYVKSYATWNEADAWLRRQQKRYRRSNPEAPDAGSSSESDDNEDDIHNPDEDADSDKHAHSNGRWDNLYQGDERRTSRDWNPP